MTVTAKDINGNDIKVGDTVERVEGYNGNMVVGDKGVVLDIESGFYLTIEGYNLQHVARKCKKLIQPPLTKSDLKDGMVVTYRNGKNRLVFEQKLHFKSITDKGTLYVDIPLEYFTEDLTLTNYPQEDIVKVSYMNEVLWEREEPLTKEQLRIKELEKGIAKMQEELNKLL